MRGLNRGEEVQAGWRVHWMKDTEDIEAAGQKEEKHHWEESGYAEGGCERREDQGEVQAAPRYRTTSYIIGSGGIWTHASWETGA